MNDERKSKWQELRTALVAVLRVAAGVVRHPWVAAALVAVATLLAACAGASDGVSPTVEGVRKFCESWLNLQPPASPVPPI